MKDNLDANPDLRTISGRREEQEMLLKLSVSNWTPESPHSSAPACRVPILSEVWDSLASQEAPRSGENYFTEKWKGASVFALIWRRRPILSLMN